MYLLEEPTEPMKFSLPLNAIKILSLPKTFSNEKNSELY